MRVLSGIQPSGTLHLGNYFGAIRQHIAMQTGHEAYYFIADYHALTSVRDAQQLRDYTRDVAMTYLALGLDPKQAVFFRQSDVPEVCELAWILSTVTPMGLLQRCHAYKEKIDQGLTPDHGLFAYPVLMAADILIYQSNVVPVGQDQKQHVEVTRDIAIKFNSIYGEVLTVPEERILPEVAIVPGVDGRKMSKSYGNTIPLFDTGNPLKKRVMSVVTDSTPVEAPKDPAKCNVFALLKLFATAEERAAWEQRYRAGGMGYGEAKKRLLELIDAHFAPARARRAELERDPGIVERVLQDGAARARAVAQRTIKAVRQSVGMA